MGEISTILKTQTRSKSLKVTFQKKHKCVKTWGNFKIPGDLICLGKNRNP